MIPILYEKNETEFISNGLGRLRDIIRCECLEERNGAFEVEFDYPVDGAHFDEILLGRIISVEHDETNEPQPFDIYYYSRPINGVVTFKACHISYRQREMVVAAKNVNSLAIAFIMLRTATPSNPFSYTTDMNKDTRLGAADGTPRTVREMLGGVQGSILDTYGGEYEWDKWQVKLWKSRGEVRDFTIRYGVNMMDYTDEMDYSNSYTSVVPFWSKDGSLIVGNEVESGAVGYNGRDVCVPLDLTDKYENMPTEADLEAGALSYLQSTQPSLPTRTISVDFVRLQDSDEYHQFANLQKCRLCDSIKVVFPRYQTEGTFKIVKVVWDVLLERYKSMELGSLSRSLSEALGITTESTESGQIIETGTITGSSVSAGSYTDYSPTFSKTFHNAPIVVACFQSTSTAGAFGKCMLGVVSTTTSGFTVRVFNGDTSGRGPNINWIAIGS